MSIEPPENIPSAYKPNRPDFLKQFEEKEIEKKKEPVYQNKSNLSPNFAPSFKIEKPVIENKKPKTFEKKESYLKKVASFYFAPLLRSFFTVLYLMFFVYFVIFYFENLITAIRFLLYTMMATTLALSIDHLFWGALFVIVLVIPFSVSMYAIFIPFEVRKMSHWNKTKKITVILFAFIATIDAVIIADFATRVIERQRPIEKFLYDKDIVIRKNY